MAGLIERSVIPTNSRMQRFIACLGDEELFDRQEGVMAIPAAPVLIKPVTLRISNLQLDIPERAALEARMCELCEKSFADHSKDNIGKLKAQILSRTLKIGLHNGHTIVGGRWLTIPLLADKSESNLFLIKEPNVTNLNDYSPTKSMALTFVVEYELGLPNAKTNHFDTLAMVKSAKLGRNTHKEFHSRLLTLGAALFVPSDGVTLSLKSFRDSRDDEYGGLNVELLFRKDEACSIISPKPVMQDQETEKVALDASAVRNSLDMMKSVRKSVESIRSSLELANEPTSLDFDEPSRAMLGFDLQAFWGEELEHNQNIEHILREGLQEKIAPPEVVKKVRKSVEIIKEDSESEEVKSKSSVSEESDRSSLRLDAEYYASQRRQVYYSDSETDDDKFIRVPKDKNSLLARSLKSKLISKNKVVDELLDYTPQKIKMRVAPKTAIGASGNHIYYRELTRGAKTRLNRHGFDGVITDSNVYDLIGTSPVKLMTNTALDLIAEANDNLYVNEINLQFAGFRSGAKVSDASGPAIINDHNPRRMYFTFQFYTCASTRTEVLRLLPTDHGRLNVLLRDESYARDEIPLVLRYVIDCSNISPTEIYEFVDYLAYSTLFIDVWDADSLMIIGTFGIPLRNLLRQGKKFVKHSLECDVINSELNAPSDGGVTSMTVTEGGPIVGTIVGAVHVIISNHGAEGFGKYSLAKRNKHNVENNEYTQGLNWRAFGVNHPKLYSLPDKRSPRTVSRPSNTTRAKPLSESSPELARALTDVRESGSGATHQRSMRSMTSIRGDEGVSTLTYDEVAILFKKFQGITKGTVQYSGPLMDLLDMPSWNVAVRKLVQCFNTYGSHEKFQMVMITLF